MTDSRVPKEISTASCFICGKGVPVFLCVRWCDDCIDRFATSGESLQTWIKRERVA